MLYAEVLSFLLLLNCEQVKQRLKLLQQTMDKATVPSSSHAAANAGSSSVHCALNSPTLCDLPVQPIWTEDSSLLVYSPPGLCASDKV